MITKEQIAKHWVNQPSNFHTFLENKLSSRTKDITRELSDTVELCANYPMAYHTDLLFQDYLMDLVRQDLTVYFDWVNYHTENQSNEVFYVQQISSFMRFARDEFDFGNRFDGSAPEIDFEHMFEDEKVIVVAGVLLLGLYHFYIAELASSILDSVDEDLQERDIDEYEQTNQDSFVFYERYYKGAIKID